MTPKFDNLFSTLMEDLSQMGKGGLANQGGGGTSSTSMKSTSNSTPTSGNSTTKSAVPNISGNKPMGNNASGLGNTDFNSIISEPDDNKAAESILTHLSQNNIDVNDPSFSESPEGIAIGQRISKNPKFADALNGAQEKMMQVAAQNTQQAFQNN